MRTRIFVAAAALLLSASLAARAEVIYTLTVTELGASDDGTFTFDEPSILTSETTIPDADITSSSSKVTIESITIDPTSSACPGSGAISGEDACVYIDYSAKSGGPFVDFYADDLTSTGSYGLGAEVLTISETAAVTPEPASFVLLGTGLLGVVGVVRRRLA